MPDTDDSNDDKQPKVELTEAQARWKAENREAIEVSNKFVETHGLWSDGLRQF